MPFSSLRKTVHATVETVYGTAPAFAGAQTFVAEDFKVDPAEGAAVERQPHDVGFGSRRQKIAPRYAKVSFKVALGRRATNVTPAPYRAALLAAGFAETVQATTSVTYSMVSTGFQSMSLVYNNDGQARTVTGIRGGVGFEFKAGEVPYMMFEGLGLYAPRAAVAPVAQLYTGWDEPDLVTQANTMFSLGGVALALEQLSVETDQLFGYRNRPNQEGVVAERVRQTTAKLSVLDEPRTVFDPETWLRTEALQALDLQHGTGAGRQVRLLAPAAQILPGLAEVDREGEAGLDLTLGLTSPLGATADYSLVLS